MARIDYSNVNISLQQFEAVASGKYNAGEVKLSGQNSLERVNNHVHFTSFNNVTIAHAEVVAIKNAFVRALSDGGVNDEEIGKIRSQLGLLPSGAADAKLDERSMKPLTRQRIREILDKYAGVLHLRTYSEIKADVPEETRQQQEETRRTVNGSLDTRRTMDSNAALVTFQRVLADDVDFMDAAAYYPTLTEAKQQLEALYAGCGDNPSTTKLAKARCALQGERSVEIDTGMTEAELASKLFQTIARLEYMDTAKHRRIDYRNEYRNLDHNARVAWIANLTQEPPDALVMARTAAIVALQEKGVTDYEALSLVNTITFDSVVDLLINLEDPEHHENWNMSRDNIVAIMRQYPTHDDGTSGCVYIPATSPSQYNRALRTFFKDLKGDCTPPSPPGFTPFAKGVLADLRARFGTGVVPEGDTLDRYISGKFPQMVPVEGEADFAHNVTRASLDGLRGPFTEMAVKSCAQRALSLFAASVVKELNVKVSNEQTIANSLTARHPDLLGRLMKCDNPGQVEDILSSVRADAEKTAHRCAILERYRKGCKLQELAAQELSALTGIPAASLAGAALPERRLIVLTGRLAGKINSGEVQAETEEEILAKFKEEARKFAEDRAAFLAKIDGLDVSDATKSKLKPFVLAQEKVSFIDFDAILGKMENVYDKALKLSDALKNARKKGNAATLEDKNAVYAAMKKLAEEADELRDKQFEAKHVDAELPEKKSLGTVIDILAIGRVDDIGDDLAHFLAREDVKQEMEEHWEDQEHPHPSLVAYRFQNFATVDFAE